MDMMKRIICLTGLLVLASSPGWGQSYDYIQQSQIADMQADMQSQHEQMEQAQWQMRDDMARMREEMATQRLQQSLDKANADDYRRYH